MERKFDGMTMDEIIDAIAQQLDFLPEDKRKSITINALYSMVM